MKKIIKRFLALVLVLCCVFSVTACSKKNTSDACAHNYVSSTTKQATCKETGTKTYTCTICNNSYTEEIAVDPYAHSGKLECRICYKNYQDVIMQYVLEHGTLTTGGLHGTGPEYYYMAYNFYSEDGTYYTLQIKAYATISCITFYLINTKILLYIDQGLVNRAKFSNETYDLNPEIVTPTLNILFDSPEAAKNIKILLDAMNRFFMSKNLGIGTRDLGFINYPSNGD